MSKLLPTSSNNPCPICAKTNGNCRIGENNYVQCMTYTDGDYSDNGYRYIGNTKDNNWGQYVINNGSNNEDYQKYLDAVESSKFTKPLTLDEVDKNLRLLFDSLSLTDKHKTHLLQRGLTEQQIKDNKFCSITGFHKLPDNIATNLVGVFIGQSGDPSIGYANANLIICPVRNGDKFIGYQKRYDRKDNKYQWAKTNEKKDKSGNLIRKEVTSHLPNGELPMAYYGVQSPQVLHLCDSVAIKPYIAHCKHNINIAGSGGLGFFINSHKEQLSSLIKDAERIIYCPDAGDIKNKNFAKAIKTLFNFILNEFNNKKLEIAWWRQEDKESNQDIDELDHLSDVEYLEYNQFIGKLKPDNHNIQSSSSTSDKPDKVSDTVTITKLIKNHFGEGMAFNELTNEIEIDGKVVNEEFDDLYINLGQQYNVDLPKQKTFDCAVNIAREKSYHPIKNYLDSLDFESNPNYFEVSKLAEFLLNIDNDLYDQMIKKWLIASVARIYDAGCKVDSMLVLQGGQGLYKSSFFRILFGDDWFTDCVTHNLKRDDLLTCHKYWGIEFDELDRITNKKDAGAVKAFITKQTDDFRKPYGKSSLAHKRRFILCGTCNKDEFLVDETGNRRFWVISIKEKIGIAYIKEIRDWIWSMAKYWYDQGEKWWLSDEDEALLAELNKQYEVDDCWQKILEDFELSNQITVQWILESVLRLEKKDQTKQNQMRISNILKKMGYKKGKYYIGSKQVRGWIKTT